MSAPAWLAATAGKIGQAGQVNQFLAAHNAQYLYGNAQIQTQQSTAAPSLDSTYQQYLSQIFTTGSSQTTIGQVLLRVAAFNGSFVTDNISPLTLSLYANSFGTPTGTPLASATVNEVYVASSGIWVAFPLITTGLTPSTQYQLVLNPAGDATHYYTWKWSNQPSGAGSSSDGVTWTAQAHGLTYRVYDSGSSGGRLLSVVEDNGARWAQFSYTGNLITGITEYCVAQDGSAFSSVRTIAYSGTNPTGVS